MKNCEVPDCIFPSFGKDKITGIRYCTGHQYLRTDLDKRSAYQKHIDKQKDKKTNSSTASKLRGLASSPVNKKMVEGSLLRSQLLLLADNLFATFIKNRDADKDGNIVCPCCNKIFNLQQKDNKGKNIVQALHFVDRDIYSHRYNEDQVFAGCCFCNLKQHLTPNGIEYKIYRLFLVKRLGNLTVTEIEDAKYKINRFSHADIQAVIDKYKISTQ